MLALTRFATLGSMYVCIYLILGGAFLSKTDSHLINSNMCLRTCIVRVLGLF